jgi:hypothetical protein
MVPIITQDFEQVGARFFEWKSRFTEPAGAITIDIS